MSQIKEKQLYQCLLFFGGAPGGNIRIFVEWLQFFRMQTFSR